ncbi:hypothetical protein SRABI13_01684 [Erwinia aphidicola]|jgi:hypothetical protein|nr:hypothetical protein [Erwinia aphidicola]CAH0199153.1 hypothetical protein SRABI13_01684 [Erwinia aphidicola]
MLASIKADTSGIERKLQALLELLPEHIPDQFGSMLSDLVDDIILVNGTPAVAAGGSFDIVCVADFSGTAYDKVMAAARAFKADSIAH